MIYKFTIISDEVEGFMREIQIDADAKFLELHKLILESCGYDDNQMTSFIICEKGWAKGQEITLEEMDTDGENYVMAETELNEFLEDEKQHLLYVFDPLGDRMFFMELSKIIRGENLKNGKVTRSQGEAPVQTLDFDELFARNPIVESSSVLDEEMYGDTIDSDELDLEGLDISDSLD
ncbi:MAG: plasmid pRiA4b ORF-3 family protein [Bacteroidales bacterium]|nr:plasmid pRiA4b ORF-3 family protein [Bacteroidales bacterium]